MVLDLFSGRTRTNGTFHGTKVSGSNSRQKPSYRHPRARVPMLSMVKYSCTVQLFRTAVLCHVINRSVTSSDTSSQERVDKTTRKICGDRKEEGWPRTGTFFAPWGCMPVMDGPIFNRLQLGTAFYQQIPPYFPRLSYIYIHIKFMYI